MKFKNEQEYFKIHEKKKGALKLGFGSTYSQSHRYGILTKDINLFKKNAILLGCGEGAGVPFLQSRGCENIYGFDIIKNHIERAKEKYPDLKNNFFTIKKTNDIRKHIKKIDWIFASGTWNVKTAVKYSKIEELLSLTDLIECGIATNFTTNVDTNDDCHNFSPAIVLEMFSEKFHKWKIDYTYFKNDFSIWGIEPKIK
jgi:hypothetical protein